MTTIRNLSFNLRSLSCLGKKSLNLLTWESDRSRSIVQATLGTSHCSLAPKGPWYTLAFKLTIRIFENTSSYCLADGPTVWNTCFPGTTVDATYQKRTIGDAVAKRWTPDSTVYTTAFALPNSFSCRVDNLEAVKLALKVCCIPKIEALAEAPTTGYVTAGREWELRFDAGWNTSGRLLAPGGDG